MKQLILAGSFVLVSIFAQAQSNKGATVKTKTKVKTSAASKTSAPKGESEEQRAERLQKIDTRARAMTATMAQHLDLSLEQQVAITRINRSSMEQVETAKVKFIKNLKKMNAEIQNIGTSRLSLIKEVLTPQQFEAYMKKREEKMGIPKENQKAASGVQQPPGGDQ